MRNSPGIGQSCKSLLASNFPVIISIFINELPEDMTKDIEHYDGYKWDVRMINLMQQGARTLQLLPQFIGDLCRSEVRRLHLDARRDGLSRACRPLHGWHRHRHRQR